MFSKPSKALKWYNKSLSEHRDKKTLEKVTKVKSSIKIRRRLTNDLD